MAASKDKDTAPATSTSAPPADYQVGQVVTDTRLGDGPALVVEVTDDEVAAVPLAPVHRVARADLEDDQDR